MVCAKCRTVTRENYNQQWGSLGVTTSQFNFRRVDICPECTEKIKKWLDAGPTVVDLELVRRPR